MIQAIMVSIVVAAGLVAIVGIICWTILRHDQKLGRKESPAVQAARDNLEISRLAAKRDALEFERDKIIDARRAGLTELPEGVVENIEEPEPKMRVVRGDVVEPRKFPK